MRHVSVFLHERDEKGDRPDDARCWQVEEVTWKELGLPARSKVATLSVYVCPKTDKLDFSSDIEVPKTKKTIDFLRRALGKRDSKQKGVKV